MDELELAACPSTDADRDDRPVPTTLAVVTDAMNASVAMGLAVAASHAVDRPFSVSPNPKCRNRPRLLRPAVVHSRIGTMEFRFQCHHYRDCLAPSHLRCAPLRYARSADQHSRTQNHICRIAM